MQPQLLETEGGVLSVGVTKDEVEGRQRWRRSIIQLEQVYVPAGSLFLAALIKK
jgi:hypothetical protein